MQIYELTQRKASVPVAEGLSDRIKAMISTDPTIAGMPDALKLQVINSKGVIKDLANKAQNAWRTFAYRLEASIPADKKAAFQDRSDGQYKSNLVAFVQKNMLAGMNPRDITNMSQIDNTIAAISDATNADDGKQTPLWQQLSQLVAQNQIAAQGPDNRLGDASTQFKTSLAGTNTDLPSIRTWMSTNRPTITGQDQATAINQIASDLDREGITIAGYRTSAGNAASVGTSLGNLVTSNPNIKSTGVPAVNELLTTLGFTITP